MVEYLLFFRDLTNINIFTTFNIFVVLKSLQTRPSHKGVRLTLCDSIPTYNRTLFSDTRSGISVVLFLGLFTAMLFPSCMTEFFGNPFQSISYATLQLAFCCGSEIGN